MMKDIIKGVLGISSILVMVMYQGGVFATDLVKPGYVDLQPTNKGAVEFLSAMRQVDEIYEESAIVTTKIKADISPRVMGVILEIFVEDGQEVKEGDILAKIDSEQMKVKLDQAKKGLAQAFVAKKQAQEALASQSASLEQAQKNYERILKYNKTQAATDQQLEQAEAAFKQAKAMHSSSEEGVRVAELEIEKAKKGVEEAEISVSYTTIRAPFSGMITARIKDPGDMAMPGQPIFRMNDTLAFQLEAHLRESVKEKVLVGQEIVIQVGSEKLRGRIEEVTPRVDPQSRTFKIKVGFQTQKNVFVGMYGKVFVPVAKKDVLLIPASAVESVGQLEIVRVIKGKQLQRRYVKTGSVYEGTMIEIRSGLNPGEKIVSAGGEL